MATALLAGCALAAAAAATGCGDDDASSASSATVQTADPERTFAPRLELAADEPWRPMSARWFIEHSVLWFAEDRGCRDRKIAVGRTLPEQQNPTIDWIYPKGLGGSPTYYRNPYAKDCKMDFSVRAYADQLTRPNDPGPRLEHARPGQGFYLDLVDAARVGPPAVAGRPDTATPVYAERTDEGDSSVRLTYWFLFGMHGAPGRPGAHEGDWARVDVLLRDRGDDRYEPQAIQLAQPPGASTTTLKTVSGPDGKPVRDTPWSAAGRVEGSHPVVRVARATHDLTVVRPGGDCADCVAWETWRSLADARAQLWHGFGGAWGEVGPTGATTGPLGPHGFWPSVADKQRELDEQATTG